ncbi:hypothetical protein [Sinorhizobium medicae]|nr:hypothetical protein [Sinorhizobium medicae]
MTSALADLDLVRASPLPFSLRNIAGQAQPCTHLEGIDEPPLFIESSVVCPDLNNKGFSRTKMPRPFPAGKRIELLFEGKFFALILTGVA